MPRFNPEIESLRCIFERHKEELFDRNGKVCPPTHPIWDTIAREADYSVSKKYLYTIISCNRHGISEKLRPSSCSESTKIHYDDVLESSSCDSDDSSERMPTTFISMTLSAREWLEICPEETRYKDGRTYSVLKPGKWSDILASHFWDLTKLPCALSFKRAKVNENGIFLQIYATCKNCRSCLTGRVTNRPAENSRLVISCTYQGAFDQCKCTMKRQLSGDNRERIARLLISNRLAPSAYRKEFANVLMEHGDVEPSILPTRNVLKNAKYEKRKEKFVCENPLGALQILKYSSPFDNYIKDIGMDRFFLHYWSTPQIHVYNNYCRKVPYSKIAIDATGRVVRKLERPNGEKSKAIFLYDVALKDTITRMQYSVCNMLSERHDSDSITHWLKFWRRDGALIPSEVVSDMSIPLMSAAIRTFTNFASLELYLQYCYDYLVLKHTDNGGLSCYVRCDVAHVIKIFCGWPCLKAALPRSRQFYKRCLGQLLQASNIECAKAILESLFVVALSETGGKNSTGDETPCEKHKRTLRKLIGDELSEFDHEGTTENDSVSLDDNSFVQWGRNIETIARQKILEGDEDNCQYLPAIVPQIIKFLKLLPMWSHVMSSAFPGSSRTASSSSVELNFNDIKNRIFSNYTLPLRLDEFLTVHIRSLEGTMKLAASGLHHQVQAEHSEASEDIDLNPNESAEAERQFSSNPSVGASPLDEFPEDIFPEPTQGAAAAEKIAHTPSVTVIPLDELPEDISSAPVKRAAAVKRCAHIPSEGEIHLDELNEFAEQENWGGEVIEPRKRSSYLQKNSEWLHIDLNQKVNVIPIGILRNGNHSNLRALKINNRNYVMRNTCGFDALVTLLCSNYCDSRVISEEIDENSSDITAMVKQMIKQVGAKAYTLRGLFLLRIFDGDSEVIKLPNDTYEIATQCTIESLVRKLCRLGELKYSITEAIRCPECSHLRTVVRAVLSFTCPSYLEFQEELDNYLNSFNNTRACVRPNCTSRSTSSLKTNQGYVFVEPTDRRGRIISTTLRLVPTRISIQGRIYELGGLIAYSGSQNNDPHTMGHFRSYCRRLNGKWEMYDDLLNKKVDCSIAEEVVPHLFLYRGMHRT